MLTHTLATEFGCCSHYTCCAGRCNCSRIQLADRWHVLPLAREEQEQEQSRSRDKASDMFSGLLHGYPNPWPSLKMCVCHISILCMQLLSAGRIRSGMFGTEKYKRQFLLTWRRRSCYNSTLNWLKGPHPPSQAGFLSPPWALPRLHRWACR